jgi:WD40 repeat protein
VPTGKWLACARYKGTIRVWGSPDFGQYVILTGYEGELKQAGYSPDGRYFATLGADGLVRAWDMSKVK